MKTKLKRLLLTAAALIAVGFITLNTIAYRQAYAMTHFVAGGNATAKPEELGLGAKLKVLFCGVDLPRPHSTLLPERLGPACRSLIIYETNGIRLGAWYCPVSPDRPLVILFHGYHGDKTGTLKEAGAFLEMGLSVLLVDFRGSGDSSESYTTVGQLEAEDVAAAVRYARSRLPHTKLVLYGISMGAASILRAAHSCGVEPDAIIAEAVFDRMLTTVQHRFELMGVPTFPGSQLLVFWGGRQFGFNGFANNPVDYAASVRCPILFLHGADDARARLAEARNVFDAVPGRKWFKEFAGVAHAPIVARYRGQWKDTVRQFLADAGVAIETPVPASQGARAG